MERLTSRGFRWVLILGSLLVAATARAQETWTPIDPGEQVLSVAVDPSSPEIVYAGVASGVARSTDGGATWTASGGGLPGAVTALIVDPSASSTLYAVSVGDIYKSDDATASWRRVYDSVGYGVSVSGLVLDPASPASLYAVVHPFCFPPFGCASGGGIQRSTDGGATWSLVSAEWASAIAVSGSTVYAGVGGRVRKSTQGGGGWIDVTPPGLGAAVRALAIDPGTPDIVYLGSAGAGVFKSRDGGATWAQLNRGLEDEDVSSLAVDPRSPSTVYAGTPSGVFRSTDGGATWYASLRGVGISSIRVAATSPSTVYAMAYYGLFRATLGPSGPCEPDSTHLCLGGGRFRAQVSWRAVRVGRDGAGQAVSLTPNTGYFWFFNAANVELAVKVVDGTFVNGRFWVFAGALSDVEYTLVVTDTTSGETRAYFNPQDSLSSFADTSAFPGTDGSSAQTIAASSESPRSMTAYLGQVETCAAGPGALCLNGGRFKVDVSWQTGDGRSGEGQAVPLTSDTGYFWFFNDANVELVIKLLDGRPVNGHYWVFYGALSNVAYTITVTDTQTGILKTYENPQGQFASLADTKAF